jgi:hypothetical protein
MSTTKDKIQAATVEVEAATGLLTERTDALTAPEKVPVQVALSRIIAEMPAIGKDQQMGTGQYGYAYRGIEQITQHVQPLLAKHGVVIVPKSTLIGITPALDAKPGWQDAVLSTEWTIIGPDGSHVTAQTVGVGRDNSDKSVNKAASQNFKYLLLQLLCIADSKDDADGLPNTSLSEPDPIAELFTRIKGFKGTPMEDALKDLAARNERALTPKGLAEDPDWVTVVVEFIANNEGVING